MNESIKRIEEKIAYLERHVTQQDKAMLEMADEIAALRRELKAFRDRASSASPPAAAQENEERPPHY